MIIGVTGRIGSGKGELSKYLAEDGFNKLAFGEEVRKEAISQEIPETRENLQKLGHELRKEQEDCIWTKRLADQIKTTHDYIIDGFRYPDQIELFNKRFENFYLIAVDALEELRFERLKKRGREGDPKTWEEFWIQDGRDWVGYLSNSGQNTRGCFYLVDEKIENNSTLENFKDKINIAIDSLSLIC